jgi:hypothetical protein
MSRYPYAQILHTVDGEPPTDKDLQTARLHELVRNLESRGLLLGTLQAARVLDAEGTVLCEKSPQ